MRPEEIDWWAITPGWWKLRSRTLGGLAHEQFRTMLRETYPAQLPAEDSGWVERFGRDVDWTGTQVYAEAQREDRARRTVLPRARDERAGLERVNRVQGLGRVVVRPEDQDEVYRAQVQRRGRGVCSGWADEEDYGPRYT